MLHYTVGMFIYNIKYLSFYLIKSNNFTVINNVVVNISKILRFVFFTDTIKNYSSFKYQPYHLNEPFPINPSHQMIYGYIISSLYYSMNRYNILYHR